MAIVFKKQIKRQRNLVLIFLGLLAITAFIVWRGGQSIERSFSSGLSIGFNEVKINFDLFENKFFKELQPMEKTPSFEGQSGRENPFLAP